MSSSLRSSKSTGSPRKKAAAKPSKKAAAKPRKRGGEESGTFGPKKKTKK